MPSAWLSTPLDIYEKHVELASVGQAQAIREILDGAISKYRPESILYLGCAGGNGLEPTKGIHVIGLDLNPEYVAAAKCRYPAAEFHVCDLNRVIPSFQPVHLAFGALVFEYLDNLEEVLAKVATRTVAGGRLIAPLLQSAAGVPAVLPSPYLSALEPLGREYKTLEPAAFIAHAIKAGFLLEGRSERPLPSGKQFLTLELQRL